MGDDDHLRAPRARLHARASRTCRKRCAARCAGLAHPAALAHLTRLGVTTVELMPIGAWIDERHLAAPRPRQLLGLQPGRLRSLRIRGSLPAASTRSEAPSAALHAAGIEVILDVVLNHTGEGDALGPTVSLARPRQRDVLPDATRTIARATSTTPAAATRWRSTGRRRCVSRSTCFATMRRSPASTAFASISPRRSAAATTASMPRRRSCRRSRRIPLLRELKLIAEPWDVGPGGYRLGAFPPEWGEWNDRYRDALRRYWRGDAGRVGELATRLAGSSDIFAARSRAAVALDQLRRRARRLHARRPRVLRDEAQRGERRGQPRRQQRRITRGITASRARPTIRRSSPRASATSATSSPRSSCRAARRCSRWATSSGARSSGNNNGYAQDNALTWLDWSAADDALIAFVARLVDFAQASRRAARGSLAGRHCRPSPADCPTSNGGVRTASPMDSADWTNPERRSLVVVLRPRNADAGLRAAASAIAFNAGNDPARRSVARTRATATPGTRCIDTALPTGLPDGERLRRGRRHDRSRSPVAGRRQRRNRTVRPRAEGRGVAPRGPRPSSPRRRVSPRIGGMSPAQRHIVGADTKRALLAAMGFRVDSTSDAHAHLAAIWQRMARAHSASGSAADSSRDGRTGAARSLLPPAELRAGARRFGLAAHLYAAAAQRRSGHRRFHDARRDGGAATARAGGSIVGINPLHALFPEERERASPYHPSDRRFLDPIYIDVERVPDLAASDEARALLAQGQRSRGARRERRRRLRRRLGS